MNFSEAHNVPLVAISILNWNGWQDTLECLESVRRLDYPNYLTVVVDNGSWNGSADKIKAWAESNLGPGHAFADYSRETALAGGHPETEKALDRAPSPARLVLIRNEENLGFTGGNNVSIHYALQRSAAADYVFLLNNDAKVESDCVAQLVRAGQATDAGIVGAMIKSSEDDQPNVLGWDESITPVQRFIYPISWRPKAHYESAGDFKPMLWVSGAAMLISADTLNDVYALKMHYLDEKLFLYAEDVDLCHSARMTGHKTVVAPRAVISHHASTSSGGGSSPVAYYYLNRNRVFTAQRQLPNPWRALFHGTNGVACLIRAAKNLAKGRVRSARAIILGLVDGYRGVNGKWKFHDREVMHRIRARSED
ncbi:MAG TPA: glycosyltransferase family 2 protein [Terriglobia bacterium]|nr:glycosyltransferase family 2 protein [Terriglobia bacterium]